MSIKIVSDSSSNMFECPGVEYTTVPMKIRFDDKEYIDTPDCDVYGMVTALKTFKGKSQTSCPNVSEWEAAFEGAENAFGVTISSSLSGSYNAARIAQDTLEGQHIHIVDSLATGGFMRLIIEKLAELDKLNLSFEEMVTKIEEYKASMGCIFTLESLANLANNGRVSPIVAKGAEFFGIRLVGKASEIGTIDIVHKFKGKKKAVSGTFDTLIELGYKGGKIVIDHVFNIEAAEGLKELILEAFPNAPVVIQPCTALCSYYAELGGLIIGFEK